MTLVLACLTQKFVIQVADRRLTMPPKPNDAADAPRVLVDDSRNKIVVYCAQLAFGYSGLAEIATTNTDEWLAKRLAESPTLNDALPRIRDEMTEWFRNLKMEKSRKRHVFSAVGWVAPGPQDLVPGQLTISNALDDNGKWLREAKDSFEIDGLRFKPTTSYHVCDPVGAFVQESWMQELRDNVGRCVDRDVSPTEIVRLLAETIRRKNDESVGKSLLAVVLPKAAVANRPVMLMTPLAPSGISHDVPMFYHIPENSDDLVWEVPAFVCNGVNMAGTFASGPPADIPIDPDKAAFSSDAVISIDSLRAFVLNGDHSRRLIGFLRKSGYRVEGWGLTAGFVQQLRYVGLSKISQLESTLQGAAKWDEEFLLAKAKHLVSAYGTSLDKFTMVLEGPLMDVVIATSAERLSPELQRQIGFSSEDVRIALEIRRKFEKS